MQKTVVSILLSLIFFLLQTTLVRYLSIAGVVPDLLLIWIVYLAIREGQAAGTIAGFCLGLTVDLVSGEDGMMGLAALSKTLAGFTAGYFYNENKTVQTLSGYPFLIAIAVASFVHNVLYFLIFLQGTDIGWWRAITLYGIPTTLYTAAVGLLPMFVFARRHMI